MQSHIYLPQVIIEQVIYQIFTISRTFRMAQPKLMLTLSSKYLINIRF